MGLAARLGSLGADHRDTLWSMTNLALALGDLSQYHQAERLVRSALDSRERRLGPDHDDTAWSRTVLARVPLGAGEIEEAERLLRSCLVTETAGPWRHSAARQMLGEVLTRRNRFEEAERTLLELHAEAERDPDTLRAADAGGPAPAPRGVGPPRPQGRSRGAGGRLAVAARQNRVNARAIAPRTLRIRYCAGGPHEGSAASCSRGPRLAVAVSGVYGTMILPSQSSSPSALPRGSAPVSSTLGCSVHVREDCGYDTGAGFQIDLRDAEVAAPGGVCPQGLTGKVAR